MIVFKIDRSRPKLPEAEGVLDVLDVQHVMRDAQEICSTRQDDDAEIWFLTPAGQFVRCTGVDEDRYLIVPVDEAREALEDLGLEDDRLAALTAAGAFEVAAPVRAPGL